MKFKDFLHESMVVIYHGDNYNTVRLEPKLMNNGNNQLGTGIYFGNKVEIAEAYGKDIVQIEINVSKLLQAESRLGRLSTAKIYNLLKALHKSDNEILYYDMMDWGIEVQEPEDITDYDIKEFASMLGDEQIRNFQTDYSSKFGVELFVKLWMKYVKIQGTYQEQGNGKTWYAIIDPSAEIDESVDIGPYSIIGAHVSIRARSWIGPHVVIKGPTRIGEDNRIYQFASLGEDPQDKKFHGEKTWLNIGDRNTIREYVTLNRGTEDRKETRIGNDCLLMAYTHVAHDCLVGNNVIMANAASIAGHVTVGEFAILGGFTIVHQFCRIGCHSFTAMGCQITTRASICHSSPVIVKVCVNCVSAIRICA